MDEGSKRLPSLPFILVSFCFLTIVGVCLALILSMTGGVFVYGLDDAYIHLSLARSLRESGVWGMDGANFASASSSLIWPPLIALFTLVFRAELWMPFVLNVIFALWSLWIAFKILPERGISDQGRTIALFVFMLLGPLPILVFTGMEHTLQIGATLLLASYATRVVAAEHGEILLRDLVSMFAAAILCTLVRYETLFVTAAVCVLLLMRGRLLFSLLLGACAWIPAITFGVYSRSQGWFFFPNSLMLKTNNPLAGMDEPGGWFQQTVAALYDVVLTFASQFVVTPSLLFMLAALCVFSRFLAKKGRDWASPEQALAVIFSIAVVEHMLLASVDGAVYRYEAYLVGLGWIALVRQWVAAREYQAHGAPPLWFQPLRVGLCLLLFCGPRMIVAGLGVPLASRGIYEQQYQMAEFLRRYYSGTTVAVNDIGLVNYRGQVKILDLFGLADHQVAKAKRAGIFDTGTMARIVTERGATLAIVYTDWFEGYGGVPPEWVKAGEWTVPFTFVGGGPTVSFYAVDPRDAERLRANLRSFRSSLPVWVTAHD